MARWDNSDRSIIRADVAAPHQQRPRRGCSQLAERLWQTVFPWSRNGFGRIVTVPPVGQQHCRPSRLYELYGYQRHRHRPVLLPYRRAGIREGARLIGNNTWFMKLLDTTLLHDTIVS